MNCRMTLRTCSGFKEYLSFEGTANVPGGVEYCHTGCYNESELCAPYTRGRNVKMKKNIRYIICVLCFVGLAFLDWIRGSQRGDYWMTANNLNGVFMGIIMMSHFSWKEQPKRRYLIWTLLWLAGSVVGYPVCCGDGDTIFPTQYWAATVSAWFIGTVALRMWGDRQQIRKQSGKVSFLWIIWLVMSVLMCVSRMGEIWPGWYAVIFGLFYLMPYSGEERKALWNSLADGMIVFFFCMQIWAYGFRPYDEVRYSGPYGDCIKAALFYLVTYIALLYRSHTFRWQERMEGVAVNGMRKVVKIILWLLTVGMWGFVLLTMTRTALLVMIGLTLVYAIIEFGIIFPERWHRLFLRMAAFVVGIIVLFPVVYGTARYLPTILHHPVWFVGEYSVDKVHSYDPADSDKYISMDEVLENLLGRLGVKLSGWFQGSVAGEELELLCTSNENKEILIASTELSVSAPDNARA